MSTYDVDITLGSNTFSISSTDAPIEDTITVLDNLTIGWRFAENAPRPVQPDPVTCSLGLLTRDVDNLADIDIGTPLQVLVSSDGNAVAAFAGRVAQITASPQVLKNPDGTDGRAMFYQLDAVDYVVDLAELLITVNRPVEVISDRLNAITAAITTAGGALVDWPPFNFDSNVDYFDAYAAVQQPALDVLTEHVRQLAHPSASELSGLLLITPYTAAGVLTKYDMGWPILTNATMVWPPASWAIIDGKLMIDPEGGPLPPGRIPLYDGLPIGLSIDGCRVLLDGVEWIRSKFGAVNYVSVTGPDTTAVASRPAEQVIKLALESTLLLSAPGPNHVQEMADMYLPDADSDRWAIDAVTWQPSDAELAALPFPLAPDTGGLSTNPYEIVDGPIVGPSAYYAPVVIREVPNELNPGSDLGYLAGTLSSVQLTIKRKTITAELGITRQLPKNTDVSGSGVIGTTWDDLAADFPTITWADVDPRPTWYDARLAHG